MPRKTKAKTKAKTPRNPFTRLFPLPPRTWAAPAAAPAAAAQAAYAALYPTPTCRNAADYTVLWHTLLAERDEAELARLNYAISRNNADVASLAHNLDLGVKRVADTVLQYDAAEMARRIEAAAANHARRKANRSTSANRNLKYVCHTCQRPVRSAGSDRVIMCGGTYSVPHTPAVCEPVEMPANRAEDALIAADMAPDPALTSTSEDGRSYVQQSAVQSAAHTKRLAARMAALQAKGHAATPDDEIPF